MADVYLKLDDTLKIQAEKIAQELGMDLSGAIRVFLSQMVRENGFPFIPTKEPFYAYKNQEALRRSASQIIAGNIVSKSMEELRSME